MALYNCADVPLGNYSLTHCRDICGRKTFPVLTWNQCCTWYTSAASSWLCCELYNFKLWRRWWFVGQVKPLGVIWGKFPQWSRTNTVMVDDLRRNFIMNPENGLKVVHCFVQLFVNQTFTACYLTDLLIEWLTNLHSACGGQWDVPRYRLSTYKARSFIYAVAPCGLGSIVQSGPQKTVPYIILLKMLLHLFIRTKWHTI